MKQYFWIFELFARWYVFIKISIYGLGKIIGGQFHRSGKIPKEIAETTISDIGSFDLAWTFFGHSEIYILFIGISQLLGGGLLLFNRSKLLGVGILIPILLNIIIVDYAFEISNGAMFSAILYLALCFYILYYNRKQLREAVQIVMRSFKTQRDKKSQWIGYALTLVLVIGISVVEVLLIDLIGR